jgi:hypothetical protein
VLSHRTDAAVLEAVRRGVAELVERFPLYPELRKEPLGSGQLPTARRSSP